MPVPSPQGQVCPCPHPWPGLLWGRLGATAVPGSSWALHARRVKPTGQEVNRVPGCWRRLRTEKLISGHWPGRFPPKLSLPLSLGAQAAGGPAQVAHTCWHNTGTAPGTDTDTPAARDRPRHRSRGPPGGRSKELPCPAPGWLERRRSPMRAPCPGAWCMFGGSPPGAGQAQLGTACSQTLWKPVHPVPSGCLAGRTDGGNWSHCRGGRVAGSQPCRGAQSRHEARASSLPSVRPVGVLPAPPVSSTRSHQYRPA